MGMRDFLTSMVQAARSPQQATSQSEAAQRVAREMDEKVVSLLVRSEPQWVSTPGYSLPFALMVCEEVGHTLPPVTLPVGGYAEVQVECETCHHAVIVSSYSGGTRL